MRVRPHRADNRLIGARIGVWKSFLHYALLGGYLFGNGVWAAFREGMDRTGMWSPPSRSRDGGNRLNGFPLGAWEVEGVNQAAVYADGRFAGAGDWVFGYEGLVELAGAAF